MLTSCYRGGVNNYADSFGGVVLRVSSFGFGVVILYLIRFLVGHLFP